MKNNSVIYSRVFFVSFLFLLSMFHVLHVNAAGLSQKQSELQAQPQSQPFSTKQSLSSVKSKKLRLQSKIQSISKSVKLKENQRSRLQKKIFSADKEIEKLGLILFDISKKQASAQSRLSNLEQEKSNLLIDIELSNSSMSQLMQAFYLLQNQKPLKTLINLENIGKTGRLKVYHDYLIKDYLQQYQTLNTQFEELKTLDKTLTKRISVLNKLAEENRQQTVVLQDRYNQRNTDLAKLATEIKSDTSKIARLKKDHTRLEKLAKAIAKLKREKSSGTSFAKLKGGLSWPVNGRVIQKFGRIRAGSKLKWRGVLIETKAGASVSAISKGRVVFSDWLTGYGFVLIIEHGRGYMSLYAHNQQLLAKVGDQVRENQQIALAGNSGRRGKPALYFEIRHKGKTVNPAKWIISRKSRK